MVRYIEEHRSQPSCTGALIAWQIRLLSVVDDTE